MQNVDMQKISLYKRTYRGINILRVQGLQNSCQLLLQSLQMSSQPSLSEKAATAMPFVQDIDINVYASLFNLDHDLKRRHKVLACQADT